MHLKLQQIKKNKIIWIFDSYIAHCFTYIYNVAKPHLRLLNV